MSTTKPTAILAVFIIATCTAASLHAAPFQREHRLLPAYNVEQSSQEASRPSFQKIDKAWPVMKQYVTAVKNLKPSVSENMAVIALLTSSFVARDIADGSWAGEVKGCILSPAGAGKAAACASASAAIEETYQDLVKAAVKPIIADPTLYDSNAYILATLAIDELNFQMERTGMGTIGAAFVEARVKELEKLLAETASAGGSAGEGGIAGVGGVGSAGGVPGTAVLPSSSGKGGGMCSMTGTSDGEGGDIILVAKGGESFEGVGNNPALPENSILRQPKMGPDGPCPIDFGGRFASEPEGGGTPPAGEGGKPAGDGGKPDGDGSKPDGDGSKPDGDGSKPDADGSKPDADGSKPDADGSKPDGGGSPPAGSGGTPGGVSFTPTSGGGVVNGDGFRAGGGTSLDGGYSGYVEIEIGGGVFGGGAGGISGSGGGWAGVGFGGTFYPNPADTETTPGGICDDDLELIAGCDPDDDGNSCDGTDSKNWKKPGGPDPGPDGPTTGPFAGDCGGGGSGPPPHKPGDFVTDPSPEPAGGTEGGGGDVDGDPCGGIDPVASEGSMEGGAGNLFEKKECCQKNPGSPSCGDGGGPVMMQGMAETKGQPSGAGTLTNTAAVDGSTAATAGGTFKTIISAITSLLK